MGKRKNLDKKKRSTVRIKSWEDQHDTAFSHDLIRHTRALAKLPQHFAHTDPLPDSFEPNATVVSHSHKWAFVKLDSPQAGTTETQLCLVDERLREQEESLLAPGDRVYVEKSEECMMVRGIAPRQTRLARSAGPHSKVKQQVIAANIDQLMIVASAAQPPFRPGLIDRFLIVAEQGNVTPLLCLNKIDLVAQEPEEMSIYRALNLNIVCTSCKTGEGIADLKKRLEGKISVLAGHSGVGKSSILNCLDPNARAYTREISTTTKKGRHATTAATLYTLDGNIVIIDTPGIRALGLWNISPTEVAFYFPEITEAAKACKFSNCTHIHEIKCAVIRAVKDGIISEQRYESYRRIRSSLCDQ